MQCSYLIVTYFHENLISQFSENIYTLNNTQRCNLTDFFFVGITKSANWYNQKLANTGEIDARCCGINKSLPDMYCDIILCKAIHDLLCPIAKNSSTNCFLYTFTNAW